MATRAKKPAPAEHGDVDADAVLATYANWLK